jgi:hypothetical protein
MAYGEPHGRTGLELLAQWTPIVQAAAVAYLMRRLHESDLRRVTDLGDLVRALVGIPDRAHRTGH